MFKCFVIYLVIKYIGNIFFNTKDIFRKYLRSLYLSL